MQHGERARRCAGREQHRRKSRRSGGLAEIEARWRERSADSPRLRREAARRRCRAHGQRAANVERIAPVEAQLVRLHHPGDGARHAAVHRRDWKFSAQATGRNVALAAGQRARLPAHCRATPSTNSQHINDGRYGNGRSWISNGPGEVGCNSNCREPEQIERIVWGRDRERAIKDRLPTKYRHRGGRQAGRHGGRSPVPTTGRRVQGRAAPIPTGLSATDRAACQKAAERQKVLEDRLKTLHGRRCVYAGRFRRRSRRIACTAATSCRNVKWSPPGARQFGAPSHCRSMRLSSQRRLALANWIADPKNPLTRTCAGQPPLAVPLRHGHRRHAERFRPQRRPAHRIPSCSTGWRASSSPAAGA